MIGMMLAVSLTAWGFLTMLGFDMNNQRAGGFIAFISGLTGMISFFTFAIWGERISNALKGIFKK